MPRQRRRIDLGGLQAFYSVYAIGDIHGCIKELKYAEMKVSEDIEKRGRAGVIIYLGDYVDRGPKSAEVLHHLIKDRPRRFRRLPLCGNHDDEFLNFIESPTNAEGWLHLGGRETLRSYGIDVRQILRRDVSAPERAEIVANAVPQSHIDFLRQLPVAATIDDYIFVHAGIRPGLQMEHQTERDMLWIREPFLSQGSGLPATVVHGHTVTPEPVFAPGRIGIDTGAYATGRLSVLRIADGQATTL